MVAASVASKKIYSIAPRLLYIKHGTWIRYTFGEFRLLNRLELATFLLSGLVLYLYNLENVSNRSIYNICMGHSETFQVQAKQNSRGQCYKAIAALK